MAKNSRSTPRLSARERRAQALEVPTTDHSAPSRERRSTEPVRPLNEAQKVYYNAIKNYQLVFGVGPAGTGKTWMCAAMAVESLLDGDCNKIVVTRPAVEAGESLGFLPGELDEKFDPYLWPFRDVFNERLGSSRVDNLLKSGTIEAAPLAYMRGRTFRNCVVILDEAQNATPAQMKMFLTRIGQGCKVIVNGDMAQSDIRGPSGLDDAVKRLAWIPSVQIVTFHRDDIVRSGLCQDIVESYERETG
jgi:phosphate starvation-inducible protein PhoH and related proteins